MTRIGFRHILRAEFTKTLTLRSIRATLAAALIVPAALALASGLAFDPARGTQFPLESHGFETAGFGQPLVILLAALINGLILGVIAVTIFATAPGVSRNASVRAISRSTCGVPVGNVSINAVPMAVYGAVSLMRSARTIDRCMARSRPMRSLPFGPVWSSASWRSSMGGMSVDTPAVCASTTCASMAAGIGSAIAASRHTFLSTRRRSWRAA